MSEVNVNIVIAAAISDADRKRFEEHSGYIGRALQRFLQGYVTNTHLPECVEMLSAKVYGVKIEER